MDRKDYLRITALGFSTAVLPKLSLASSHSHGNGMQNFRLGVASYSLRKFSTEQALDMTLRCGVNRITFKNMHLPIESDAKTIIETVELCKQKGMELYGCGVVTMKTKEDVEQVFHYAKTAGMEIIIGVPYPDVLPFVEQKVKEFNIKLAIHNHGPGDDLYPSVESAYLKIRHMDQRMGLCVDIGHTKRLNQDPAMNIQDYFDRIFDIHIKDVTSASEEGDTCIIGRGVINFPTLLKSLKKLRYQGTLALEYEADEDDPLPGMMESLGYVKGILATI